MPEADYLYGKRIVNSLSQENYSEIVNGIAQTYDFDMLIAGGAYAISKNAKASIRHALSKADIAPNLIATDRNLELVATAIIGRSFSRE